MVGSFVQNIVPLKYYHTIRPSPSLFILFIMDKTILEKNVKWSTNCRIKERKLGLNFGLQLK
jgi:hypothetical protein